MRVLIVKLSSLGDVVHALPALQDIRRALPSARVDWVVEPAFAPLVRRAEGVGRVVEAPLRRASQRWWSANARAALARLRRELGGVEAVADLEANAEVGVPAIASARAPASYRVAGYDAVIDLQGLTKSALVARLAPLRAGGHRYGLGNRTDGAGWEPPARWLVDRPLPVPRRIHAMDRSRTLCAAALGFVVNGPPRYGLRADGTPPASGAAPTVAFIHGSSRGDKCWPAAHWHALGLRVLADGWRIALPQGSAVELQRARELAADWGAASAGRVEVWPALALDAVVDRLAATQGVIGVDSGLSHVAVALDVPHVQLYNFPTAWRTGPQAAHGHAHQCALEGEPVPSVEAVWQAWQRVAGARRHEARERHVAPAVLDTAAPLGLKTPAAAPNAAGAAPAPSTSVGALDGVALAAGVVAPAIGTPEADAPEAASPIASHPAASLCVVATVAATATACVHPLKQPS